MPKTTTAKTPKAAKAGVPIGLTPAKARNRALTVWADRDEALEPQLAERTALKKAALALCADDKTYTDEKGRKIAVSKQTEGVSYADVVNAIIAGDSPADAKMVAWVQKRLKATKKSKANPHALKRLKA